MGFLPNYRMTAHIFTMCTLTDKQTKAKANSSHALLISKNILTQFVIRVCNTNWWKVLLGDKHIKLMYTNKCVVIFGKKHNKAITYREMNLEKRPLSKLVLGLCSQTQTDPTEPQDSNTVRPNQIMRKQKENYLTYWIESTKKTEQTRMLFVKHVTWQTSC